MNDHWRNFLGSLVATPGRALLTMFVIVAIILSGIIQVLMSAFITNVFQPLLVIVLLLVLIAYIWRGGTKRR